MRKTHLFQGRTVPEGVADPLARHMIAVVGRLKGDGVEPGHVQLAVGAVCADDEHRQGIEPGLNTE